MTDREIYHLSFGVRMIFENDEDEIVFIKKFIDEIDRRDIDKMLIDWLKVRANESKANKDR
ncbi:MAG: hypothetical protein JHC33_06170 [Ignisphaera sp.]|nr:hypothetical protein [Ignisphaera sp.]